MMWLIALMWAAFYNTYFGWNAFPESDAEMICDGICMILIAMAYWSSRT